MSFSVAENKPCSRDPASGGAGAAPRTSCPRLCPLARVRQSLRAPRRPGSCFGGALRGADKEARSCSHTRIAFRLSRDRKVSFRSSLLGRFVAIKSLSNLALKTQGRKENKRKKKKPSLTRFSNKTIEKVKSLLLGLSEKGVRN